MSAELLHERYRFQATLSKSYIETERGQKLYIVEGIASDQSTDQQDEMIIQKGMRFEPLLESGIINWDHQQGPENIIGEPLHGEIQPGPQFFVRGHLYVEDQERARATWTTAEAMNKGGRRRLGWSVEGEVLRRSGKIITDSVVRHLAMTHQPVNANSWARVVKSLTIGGALPLHTENLDDTITSVLWGDCDGGASCYNATNRRFFGGRRGMLGHLVKCKGFPEDRALDLMKGLIDSTR